MHINLEIDRPDVQSEKILNVLGDVAGERLSEPFNCLSNTSLDFLKRLHDRRAVWQRYSEGEVIHCHFMADRQGHCLRWRRRLFSPLECFIYGNEFPVTVGVGEVAEKLEWLPSLVRLKPLEKCEMFVGDPLEKSVSNALVTRAALWIAFKRKLDRVGNASRILLSKSTSEIIQRVAQAARELAHDDPDFRREEVSRTLNKVEALILGEEIRIRMNNLFPEPFQMFVCPREECLDFLEFVEQAVS